MKKVLLAFGTRPEAIKMCPVAKELLGREKINLSICLTGQHDGMLHEVMDAFGICAKYDLALMRRGERLSELNSKILSGVSRVLRVESPDLVLVHGDTATSFASALAAFYERIPIGHVEAGLRSGDIESPFPEELNRRAISMMSKYDFAPTELAKDTLIGEGKPSCGVFVTGNTVIDALRFTVRKSYSNKIIELAKGYRLVLLTAHRRENLGEPMMKMFSAIRRVIDEEKDVFIVFPVHKNPAVAEVAKRAFSGCERILLTEPLGVVDFHNIMSRSYLVITDSGGIQEEAPALKKPVLLIRNNTERPEGVRCGAVRLVGTGEGEIYNCFKEILSDGKIYREMTSIINPYGDGYASQRIADIIEKI